MVEEFIPIVMFVCMAVVAGLVIVFKAKAKTQQQETIRTAIEKGQQLTPELIAQIGAAPKKSRDKDLRGALIWFAIGGGFLSLAFAVPDEDGTRIMTAVSVFPLLIGLALLIMYRFGAKEDQ